MLIFASILISIFALILAYARLDCSLNELDASFENGVTIVEMIIGALSLCATIYFVTMGITLHDYKKKLDDILYSAEKIDTTMHSQLKETINVFSAIESMADSYEIFIRLAKGRLLCQSNYSNNEEKMEGIRCIQGYYMAKGSSRSTLSDDIKILNQLKDNPELKVSVQLALDAIQSNQKQDESPIKKINKSSNLLSKLMNYVKKMVSKKS